MYLLSQYMVLRLLVLRLLCTCRCIPYTLAASNALALPLMGEIDDNLCLDRKSRNPMNVANDQGLRSFGIHLGLILIFEDVDVLERCVWC